MSYYYNYYVGYTKDNKIYPWGPYDANHKLNCALSRSRSFASDLHNEFSVVSKEQISDELRKQFEYTDWENNIKMQQVKYLPVKDLPSSNFIQKGYFLIKDVDEYERDEYACGGDYFYNKLTPQVYAAKLDAQLKFGPNKPDEDGYTEPNASDYMYYVYPDFNCMGYEVHVLQMFVSALESYSLDCNDYVILETEG